VYVNGFTVSCGGTHLFYAGQHTRRKDLARPDRQTVSHWIDHSWQKISTRTIINTWAHIKLATRMDSDDNNAIMNDKGEGPGHFMDDSDPREEDVLVLRESYESSSEEDED